MCTGTCAQGAKSLVLLVLLAGVVPLLNGLLFELVIVVPLRVPLDQTPILYIWQVRVALTTSQQSAQVNIPC